MRLSSSNCCQQAVRRAAYDALCGTSCVMPKRLQPSFRQVRLSRTCCAPWPWAAACPHPHGMPSRSLPHNPQSNIEAAQPVQPTTATNISVDFDVQLSVLAPLAAPPRQLLPRSLHLNSLFPVQPSRTLACPNRLAWPWAGRPTSRVKPIAFRCKVLQFQGTEGPGLKSDHVIAVLGVPAGKGMAVRPE